MQTSAGSAVAVQVGGEAAGRAPESRMQQSQAIAVPRRATGPMYTDSYLLSHSSQVQPHLEHCMRFSAPQYGKDRKVLKVSKGGLER